MGDVFEYLKRFPQINHSWGVGNSLDVKGQNRIEIHDTIGFTTDSPIIYAFYFEKVKKIVIKCEEWVCQPSEHDGNIVNMEILGS